VAADLENLEKSGNLRVVRKKSEKICVLACTKFGQLVFRKIIEIIATRCQTLRLNAPNSISAGAPPQTSLGEFTALPTDPQTP